MRGVPTMPGTIQARAYRAGYSSQGNSTLASSNAVDLDPPGALAMLPYSVAALAADIKAVEVQRAEDGRVHVKGTLLLNYQGPNTLPVTSRTLFLVEDGSNAMWTTEPDCGGGAPYPYPLEHGEPLECAFDMVLQAGAAPAWLYARVGVETAGGYAGGQVTTRQVGIRIP